ncbi:hypothetical protein RERY_64000 [Rhodococcus erythropolis]|nr:hypothetical protein RERY_64000 [Rhodococcus erythropolis]
MRHELTRGWLNHWKSGDAARDHTAADRRVSVSSPMCGAFPTTKVVG